MTSSLNASELRARIARIEAGLRAIRGDDGEVSEADRDRFETLLADHDHLRRQLATEAFNRGSTERAYGGGTLTGRVSFDSDPSRVLSMGPEEARSKALRGLETRGRNLKSDQADQVDELLRSTIGENSEYMDGSLLAKRVLITESDAYKSAFAQVMSDPHPVLTGPEAEALRAFKALEREESRGMSEGSGPVGSYGIPVFIDPSIILTAQGSGNPFLQIAKVVPVNTNAWKGVSSAGVTWSFDAEASVVSDDSPTLAQPTVSVFMARGFIPFSIELGMDYVGFAEEMSALLGAGYDELLLDKFTRGTGTGEPKGILTCLSANTNVRVKVNTNPGISANDPYNVWQAVPQRNRRNASWLMSVQVNNQIRQLATANVYHLQTETLPAAWMDRLFNAPVYESPYLPSTTTSTTATEGYCITGDFSGYVIARRMGMAIELIPHLFQQNTAGSAFGYPTAQRGYFGYSRIGGSSANDNGFRLMVSS